MTIQMNTLQRYISINESVYFGGQNGFLFLAEFGNKIIRFDHSNEIFDQFVPGYIILSNKICNSFSGFKRL